MKLANTLVKSITSVLLALSLALPTLATSAADTTASTESTEAVETTAPETTAPEKSDEPEEIDCTPPEIPHSQAAAVYCVEEQQFIFEKNTTAQIYPASTVKLMTAILAVEALGNDLDREITVPVEALLELKGNRAGFKRDEVLTVRDLLYALICGGANDAALVLAHEIAGSVDAFVEMMNDKAVELGALNTNYTNPTGMHHPAMVTTAYDSMLIAVKAASSELILEMSSVEYYVIQPTNKAGMRKLYNKNCYYATNLEYLYIWSVPRGLNAGYTEEGGYCVATTAAKDGLTYVVLTMGADRDNKYIYSYTEAATLVKWALRSYSYQSVLTTADMICEVPVKLASRVDYVSLFPSEPIELYLPNDVDLQNDVKLNWTLDSDYLIAPVSEGQAAGILTVTLDYGGKEQLLGKYELVTRNGVSRNNFLYIFDMIAGLTETRWFRNVLIVLGVAVAGYICALLYVNIPKKRKKAKKQPPRNFSGTDFIPKQPPYQGTRTDIRTGNPRRENGRR